MKKMLIVLVLAVLVSGCSGVILSPKYSALLDKTAALSAETAVRAQGGELSEADKTAALVKQAQVWKEFQAARDGKVTP